MSLALMVAGVALAWVAPGHPVAWVLFVAGVARWAWKGSRHADV